MTKDVVKEIVIALLLLVVIVLLFGILLYDYFPKSVTVPAKIQAYELPQEVQEELKETMEQESQNIIKTYYIDSSSLSVYEYTDSYDKGKVDPFTSYKTETSNSSQSTTSNTTNGSSSTNTNNNSSTNNAGTGGNEGSTGTYFNTTGKN